METLQSRTVPDGELNIADVFTIASVILFLFHLSVCYNNHYITFISVVIGLSLFLNPRMHTMTATVGVRGYSVFTSVFLFVCMFDRFARQTKNDRVHIKHY